MSGEKPRAPHIPISRYDSGKMAAVAEENVGPILSVPPQDPFEDHARRIRAVEDALGPLTSVVRTLETKVDGMTAGVDAQIQTSVKAAINEEVRPILSRLDSQDVDTSELSANVTELLKISRARERREQAKSLEDIRLSSEEQKVFSGKGRERRQNVKAIIYVLLGIAALGSAAGLSHCKHAPKLELPTGD